MSPQRHSGEPKHELEYDSLQAKIINCLQHWEVLADHARVIELRLDTQTEVDDPARDAMAAELDAINTELVNTGRAQHVDRIQLCRLSRQPDRTRQKRELARWALLRAIETASPCILQDLAHLISLAIRCGHYRNVRILPIKLTDAIGLDGLVEDFGLWFADLKLKFPWAVADTAQSIMKLAKQKVLADRKHAEQTERSWRRGWYALEDDQTPEARTLRDAILIWRKRWRLYDNEDNAWLRTVGLRALYYWAQWQDDAIKPEVLDGFIARALAKDRDPLGNRRRSLKAAARHRRSLNPAGRSWGPRPFFLFRSRPRGNPGFQYQGEKVPGPFSEEEYRPIVFAVAAGTRHLVGFARLPHEAVPGLAKRGQNRLHHYRWLALWPAYCGQNLRPKLGDFAASDLDSTEASMRRAVRQILDLAGLDREQIFI